MKKYSQEFYKQILLKLTKFEEKNIEKELFNSYGEFDLYSAIIGEYRYKINCPRDYYGVVSNIFELEIVKSNVDFAGPEFSEQYILRGNNLIKLQTLGISEEFRNKNIKYGGFYNPFPGKVVLEFDKPQKQPKYKVGLYVWWSFGRGDGDGRESEMEVNEKQYKLLSEYNHEEIDEIDEPSLTKLLDKVYKKEIKSLKDDSEEFWEPYDDDQTFEEYWEDMSTGVRIDHDFEDDIQ